MKREKDLAEFRAKHFGILNEAGEVVSCPDIMAWAEWMEESQENGARWIEVTDVQGFQVSTVFLGLNHGFTRPLWFETAVFRLAPDGVTYKRIYDALRYPTKIEAVAGHAAICAKVRSGEIGE